MGEVIQFPARKKPGVGLDIEVVMQGLQAIPPDLVTSDFSIVIDANGIVTGMIEIPRFQK